MSDTVTVLMASLHPRFEETTLTEWFKSEGENVLAGEPLYAVETYKGIFEISSEHNGTVERLLVPCGAKAKPNDPIAVIRLARGR